MPKKLSYEYIKAEIEKVEGYKLLSKGYVNNKTKLEIQCSEGHKFEGTWGGFHQSHRCFICAGKQKLSYEYVKAEIEKVEGYILLSKEYVNNKTKMKLKCPVGHEIEMNWSNFQTGNRCPECAGKKKKIIKEVREYVESQGYILISKEYKNNQTKLKMKCPKGHIFWMNWNNFYTGGNRCPECCNSKSFSKGEKEVLEYIQSITDTTIIPNDRTQILNPKTGHNLELDIFLPDLMKAIEYNGAYWHSDKETKYRDKQKVVQCKELGIDFMVIEEENWNNNEEVKNNINKWIGV